MLYQVFFYFDYTFMSSAAIHCLPVPNYPNAILFYFSFLPALEIVKKSFLEYQYDGVFNIFLDYRSVSDLPSDHLEFLLEYRRIMKEEGREIYFLEVGPTEKQTLKKIGFSDSVFFESLSDIVSAVLQNE